MRNKRILAVFTVLLAAALLAVFSGILFSVKTASVAFYGDNFVLDTDAVAADFRVLENKNILLIKERDIEAQLETSYPYLGIINTERRIPDTVVLHAFERRELFAVRTGDTGSLYAMIDETGKVLDVRAGLTAKVPLGDITGNIPVHLTLSDTEAGDKPSDTGLRWALHAYAAYISLETSSPDGFRAFMKEITPGKTQLTLATRQGTVITVYTPDTELAEKIRLAVGIIAHINGSPAYDERFCAGLELNITGKTEFTANKTFAYTP